MIIVWRFTGTRTLSETAEARAQKAVAVTFFLRSTILTHSEQDTLEHARTGLDTPLHQQFGAALVLRMLG